MSDFRATFDELKARLEPYVDRCVVHRDAEDTYTLWSPETDESGRDVWVASVEIKKSYVSFHLMPVYRFPDLLDDISDDLRARMQGKSCFNFSEVDDQLFDELFDLVDRCVQRYEEENLL